MPPLYMLSQAVILAVVVALVKKYLHMKFEYDNMLENCYCPPDMPGADARANLDHYFPMVNNFDDSMMESSHDGETKELGGIDLKQNTENRDEYVISSVWCSGINITNRICRFKNLCYHAKEDHFVIFHGVKSVIENVPAKSEDEELLSLSSVAGHNMHHFSYVDLPIESASKFNIHWINKKSLIFNRFKPDNFMHVMHDDLIPLHYTLQVIDAPVTGSGQFDIQLVLMEGWDAGLFKFLYTLFTPHMPFIKEDIVKLGEMICFKDAHVGISKVTTWYQYGFLTPQGPLHPLQVSGFLLHNTVEHILKNLSEFANIPWKSNEGKEEYIVLLSRKENRLILNELELSLSLAQETGMKIISIGFESHDFTEMIFVVRGAVGLIGMHGSLLMLSVFLQPGSFLVELFPFAVNPENYTPYKTLASLPEIGIMYRAWANQNRKNTVGYPDGHPEVGGIGDLPVEDQAEILAQTEVPPHLCCEDPSWLYHIYQDTVVDIVNVSHIAKSVLIEARNTERNSTKQPLFYPSKVRNISCIIATSNIKSPILKLSWKQPWNVEFLNTQKIHYEVLLKVEDEEKVVTYLVTEPELNVTTHIYTDRRYDVWIRAVLEESRPGLFLHISECELK